MQRNPSGKNLPGPVHPPPELLQQFLDNQSKQLDIEMAKFAFGEKQLQVHKELVTMGLEKEYADREAQRVHERALKTQTFKHTLWYIAIVIVVASASFTAAYLFKPDMISVVFILFVLLANNMYTKLFNKNKSDDKKSPVINITHEGK